MEANPELINTGPDSLLPWLTDNNYESYNGCHFWSNFEVSSLTNCMISDWKLIRFFIMNRLAPLTFSEVKDILNSSITWINWVVSFMKDGVMHLFTL